MTLNFIILAASSDGAEALAIGGIQGILTAIGFGIYYAIKDRKRLKTKFVDPDKYSDQEKIKARSNEW